MHLEIFSLVEVIKLMCIDMAGHPEESRLLTPGLKLPCLQALALSAQKDPQQKVNPRLI